MADINQPFGDSVVAHRPFPDGTVRPVFFDGARYYMVDDDGGRVYGLFDVQAEECDQGVVLDKSAR